VHSMGEDFDLVMRLHAHGPALRAAGRPSRVVHVPEANSWTEVPTRWRDLASQRVRWQRGMLETLRDRRAMLLRPRYGLIGMIVLPMFWLIDMLGPFSTALGLLVLPWLVWSATLPAWHLDLFLATTIGIGLLTSLLAVSIECRSGGVYRRPSEAALLCLACICENLGYRQLNAWWRIKGTWHHLIGTGRHWKSLARTGVRAPTATMNSMQDVIAKADATTNQPPAP